MKPTVKSRNHIELLTAEWRQVARCIESSSVPDPGGSMLSGVLLAQA